MPNNSGIFDVKGGHIKIEKSARLHAIGCSTSLDPNNQRTRTRWCEKSVDQLKPDERQAYGQEVKKGQCASDKSLVRSKN